MSPEAVDRPIAEPWMRGAGAVGQPVPEASEFPSKSAPGIAGNSSAYHTSEVLGFP